MKPSRIARQNLISSDSGMSSYEKVWQSGGSNSTSPAIFEVGFAGEECSRVRQRSSTKFVDRKHLGKIVRSSKPHRYFSVNNLIYS